MGQGKNAQILTATSSTYEFHISSVGGATSPHITPCLYCRSYRPYHNIVTFDLPQMHLQPHPTNMPHVPIICPTAKAWASHPSKAHGHTHQPFFFQASITLSRKKGCLRGYAQIEELDSLPILSFTV